MRWRTVAAASAFALVGGVLAAPGPVAAAPGHTGGTRPGSQSATPAPVAPTTDPAERAALTQARQSRRRVEVTAHRSAAGSDFANPDGTFTHQEYAHPVRVRRGDGWVPVDTRLTRRAGAVVPGATTAPVSISGGGRAALATVGGGAWSTSSSTPIIRSRLITAGSNTG